MQLRLSAKAAKQSEKVPIHKYGDFDLIKDAIDPSRGDKVLVLKGATGEAVASSEDIQALFTARDAYRLRREPVLDRAALFGSEKSFGMLGEKHYKKRNFSHTRIFGHKKMHFT